MPADSPQLHAARYVGLQIEYSLLERTVERELIPVSKDQQMTVLAWSPLRNGQLTGKYLPENSSSAESKEGRMNSEMMKGFGALDESTHAVIREAVAIGKERCLRGAGRARVAAASGGAGHPHCRRAQARTMGRQPRQPPHDPSRPSNSSAWTK
jgi:aryl-alcohol dehydrogenase-like predicted oxidoreductase